MQYNHWLVKLYVRLRYEVNIIVLLSLQGCFVSGDFLDYLKIYLHFDEGHCSRIYDLEFLYPAVSSFLF